MKKTVALIFCILLSGALVLAESGRPFTIDDCFKIKEISDIQISPDRKKIPFVTKLLKIA